MARVTGRQLGEILDLIERLNPEQEELVVDLLRAKNERRLLTGAPRPDIASAISYEEPPEPPAAAPVPARIPRGPRSGAPGAAAEPSIHSEWSVEELAWSLSGSSR